jgi:hypothetical protein
MKASEAIEMAKQSIATGDGCGNLQYQLAMYLRSIAFSLVVLAATVRPDLEVPTPGLEKI